MAVYKIFPSQDATMYSLYPSMNTGVDEIIEATTTAYGAFNPSPQVSRFLIQFDSAEINDILNNKIVARNWQANLRCYAANVTGLSEATMVYVYPVSQSWNNGTGKYLDQPITTNGVSWAWTDYSGSTPWSTVYNPGATGSYGTTVGGGTWLTSPTASQLYEYSNPIDLDVNVKNIVSGWYSGSYSNYGFLVKQANQDEFINNLDVQVELKYFSIDTNTIYPPQLEFKWDDSVFITGSSTNTIINTDQLTCTLGENPGTFYSGSINKFRVNCRPTYPVKTFQTASVYTTNYYLPVNSYWSLVDLSTNDVIIDFDSTYTKLSADSQSSYFTMYMNGLEPERYYKILLKTTVDGTTLILDDSYYFKVVNG
jgi:hypothetical protein